MADAGIQQRGAQAETIKTAAYLTPLMLAVYLVLPHNPFVDVITAFMMKNRLHAMASEVAVFRLFSAIPIYLSFAFGMVRDRWDPFGMRDRGYLLIFSLITVAVFLILAGLPLSVTGIYAGIFAAMVAFRFISAALGGLMALLGQEKLISGRIAALSQAATCVAGLVGGFAGGYVAQSYNPTTTFILLAALTLIIAVFGLLKPASVFEGIYDKPQARRTDFWRDVRRLVRHRAIYPAILIAMMWNFVPGLNTPLQYYLTNTLHASDGVFGEFTGIFYASYLPTVILYGWLCRKVRMKTLIWWAMAITVPQLIPLAFIHSGNEALLWAMPMGLMGGLSLGAIWDLAMRSCPPGLQGTLMMLVEGVYVLSSRTSDVLGSAIYEADPKNGFLWCVIVTTLIYAAILPVILLIPRQVIANADGEPNPALEADALAEIAA